LAHEGGVKGSRVAGPGGFTGSAMGRHEVPA